MTATLITLLVSLGQYGEYIWPSYIISIGTLLILAVSSRRRKINNENRLKNLENKK